MVFAGGRSTWQNDEEELLDSSTHMEVVEMEETVAEIMDGGIRIKIRKVMKKEDKRKPSGKVKAKKQEKAYKEKEIPREPDAREDKVQRALARLSSHLVPGAKDCVPARAAGRGLESPGREARERARLAMPGERPEVAVGAEHQAEVPAFLPPGVRRLEGESKERADCVWAPGGAGQLVDRFLQTAEERFDCGEEAALALLLLHGHRPAGALAPLAEGWDAEDRMAFELVHRKTFEGMRRALPGKSLGALVGRHLSQSRGRAGEEAIARVMKEEREDEMEFEGLRNNQRTYRMV
jgi:hypothetical protein